MSLPSKCQQFARQEQDGTSSGPYIYPKPTETNGPPNEATEKSSTEYGIPEATTESCKDTDLDDDTSTNNPQSDLRSLQASQFRKNAKLSRARN